jgi:hypothetical protein
VNYLELLVFLEHIVGRWSAMHVAIDDLRLDQLDVTTPREAEFPLSEKITASGLHACLRQLLSAGTLDSARDSK